MVREFFTELLKRDAGGGTWLSALLRATPGGERRFGELIDAPGWLFTMQAVRTPDGSLGAFEHPVPPPKELIEWFIDHPETLSWPTDMTLSSENVRLRRALIYDLPRGARAKAQQRARELLEVRSALSQEWWRFEDRARPDCVLITDRLAITVLEADTDVLPAATPWYPQRSVLVRSIEAAAHLARDRQWGSVLISPRPLAAGTTDAVEQAIADGAPHLDAAGRAALRDGYLGNITWARAQEAVAAAGQFSRA